MKNIIIFVLVLSLAVSVGLNIYLLNKNTKVTPVSFENGSLQSVNGLIKSVNSSKIVLNTANGDMTFKLNKDTKYSKYASSGAGETAPKNTSLSVNDIKVNSLVGVEYIISGKDNLAVNVVFIEENILSGTVISVDNGALKITSVIDGKEYNIKTNNATEILRSELPKAVNVQASSSPTATSTAIPTPEKINLKDILANDTLTIYLTSDSTSDNLTAASIIIYK